MRITRRPGTTIPGVGELPAPSEGTESAAAPSEGRVADRVQLSEAARLRASLKAGVGDPAASTTASDRLAALQADGWFVYRFLDGSVRFMCSWATTAEAVDEIGEALRRLA